jgi:tRNA dimethylallyltransferase
MKRWLDRIEDWDGDGLLSVVGPTGSGKTSASLRWATARAAAKPLLVSVDAVALYRGLDIGSAKPRGAERVGHDWIGLDLFEPAERVSAAVFVEKVRPAIRQALASGRPVLLVGGSHFYEQALVEGMSPGEPTDMEWASALAEAPGVALKARLVALDPRWSAKVHENDRYRLVRFLDLAERQGLAYDELFHAPKQDALRAPLARFALGLELGLEEMKSRLSSRIRAMFAEGWGGEVRSLLRAGLRPASPGLLSIGYKEVAEAISEGRWDGQGAPPEPLQEAVLASHMRLARSQKTWVRSLKSRTNPKGA